MFTKDDHPTAILVDYHVWVLASGSPESPSEQRPGGTDTESVDSQSNTVAGRIYTENEVRAMYGAPPR